MRMGLWEEERAIIATLVVILRIFEVTLPSRWEEEADLLFDTASGRYSDG